MNYSKR